jgi:hypothetical protein
MGKMVFQKVHLSHDTGNHSYESGEIENRMGMLSHDMGEIAHGIVQMEYSLGEIWKLILHLKNVPLQAGYCLFRLEY